MENNNLKDSIFKLIEENLPKANLEIFQKRISELEKKESELSDLKDLYDNLSKRNKNLEIEFNNLNVKHSELLQFKENIIKKEKEIFEREITLEKKILEIRLEESEKRYTSQTHMIDQIFRNKSETIHKNIIYGSDYIDGKNQKYVIGETTTKNES